MSYAREERAPSVACIVLNWNGWRDTLVCLDSLAQIAHERLEVIVVDNGSTDESVQRIRKAHPHLTLLETRSNLGFGGGTNVGLRHALAGNCEYVWLLNNDAAPQPGALAALLAKARSNPLFGVIGSRLCYSHDPSRVQAWGGGRINRWTGRTAHATSAQDDAWFDYITFASALLSRPALEDVGLFDESFFLYWEDGDLCVRLLQRGWLLGVAPNSIVLHKENASTGGNRSTIDRYSTASGIRFLSKHARVPWLSVPCFLALRLGKRLLGAQLGRLRSVLAGVHDYRQKRRAPSHETNKVVGNGQLIVYGAFKGMGDLLSAAPVIAAQLDQGARVVLLVFPQIAAFAELLDFGANGANLQLCSLPVAGRSADLRRFLRRMARLSPDLVWVSPHAPLAASSWKIPLLLGLIRKWWWPRAIYAGARSERFSWLFDRRVEVQRTLPLRAREEQAFRQLAAGPANDAVASIAFKEDIQRQRSLPALYDILIHPGASAQNRKWPFARYRELLPLLPAGSRIIFVGLPEDIAGVRAELPASNAVTFLSGSLEEAIVAMARSRAALTMDSGTMFFAALLGVPTVSLFGPSQPAQVIAAAGTGVVAIHTASCRCRPGSKTCRWQPAPCMASIDAQRVAEQIASVMQHARMREDLRVGQR